MSQPLPVARWVAAARTRRSHRSYTPEPVGGSEADQLDRFCRGFAPFEGARAVVLREAPPEIFTGWLLGVYGKVSSPSALVFIADRRLADAPARAGYTGEAAVLEAVALGFDTCWIGGGVRRAEVSSRLGLGDHEHVYSISALGHARDRGTLGQRAAAAAVRAGTHRSLAAIGPGSTSWPGWAQAGLELARIAPSATNRQPWRFSLTDDGAVQVSFAGADTPVISKRLDCGIAMLHFELGARQAGADGCWELLTRSAVARWSSDAAAETRTSP